MIAEQENHYCNELIDKYHSSAFKIQNCWRRHMINKMIQTEKERVKKGIVVYTTSLTYSSKYTTDTDRVKVIFLSEKVKFTLIDVVENISEWKQLDIQDKPFPVIFMFGYYIGTYEDLQELVDTEYLKMIINQDYERKCLKCHMPRKSLELETCPFCWKKYMFFVKNLRK